MKNQKKRREKSKYLKYGYGQVQGENDHLGVGSFWMCWVWELELESLKLQLCYPTQILKDFSTCVKDNKESLSIFGLVYGLKNKER